MVFLSMVINGVMLELLVIISMGLLVLGNVKLFLGVEIFIYVVGLVEER